MPKLVRKLAQNVAERGLIVQQQHLLVSLTPALCTSDDELLLVLISLRFNELLLLFDLAVRLGYGS